MARNIATAHGNSFQLFESQLRLKDIPSSTTFLVFGDTAMVNRVKGSYQPLSSAREETGGGDEHGDSCVRPNG